jgi:hypothetical protein
MPLKWQVTEIHYSDEHYKIAHGDIEAAAKTIAELLENKNRQDMGKARNLLRKILNYVRQYRRYIHSQKLNLR